MKRIRLAVAALATLFVVPHIAEAGLITYSIQNYPADQEGSTLSGSITTDGNLGILTATDIISWTWTISHPDLPSVTESGSAVFLIQGLIATGQDLVSPRSLDFFRCLRFGSERRRAFGLRQIPDNSGRLRGAYRLARRR